jgi:hypothetical protein
MNDLSLKIVYSFQDKQPNNITQIYENRTEFKIPTSPRNSYNFLF